MHWSAVAGTTLALLAVSLVSSCSGEQPAGGTAHPDTQVLRAGGSYLAMETEDFDGSSAGVGIGGVLRIVGGKCVGLGMGQSAQLLIFPPGTTLTGSGVDLVIHSRGVDMRLGDTVGGGTRSADSPLSDFGDLQEQLPKSCSDLLAMPFDGDPDFHVAPSSVSTSD